MLMVLKYLLDKLSIISNKVKLLFKSSLILSPYLLIQFGNVLKSGETNKMESTIFSANSNGQILKIVRTPNESSMQPKSMVNKPSSTPKMMELSLLN